MNCRTECKDKMVSVDVCSVMVAHDVRMFNPDVKGSNEEMDLGNAGCMNDVAPLLLACVNGSDKEIKRLLDAQRGRVNQAWIGGWSPLHVAVLSWFYKAEVSEGSVKCTSLLLERGHWPACRSDQGLTPLHLLCLQKCYGDALNSNDPKEEKVEAHLRSSGKGGRVEMSRVVQDLAMLLLDAGGKAVMDAEDSSGWTPLDVAVWANNSVMCDVLLKAGANISSAQTYMAKAWIAKCSSLPDPEHRRTTSAVLSPRQRPSREKKLHPFPFSHYKKGKKGKEPSTFFHFDFPTSVSCDAMVDAGAPKNNNPAVLEASKSLDLAIGVLIEQNVTTTCF